jgi:uncharacterized membrane protein YfcA
MNWRDGRQASIFVLGCGIGVLSGLLGVGGGMVLVPLLVLLFHFRQHRAQGTSLIAMVPPTGLLAFLNYAHAGQVNWRAGLLLMPGIFFGAVFGARLALRLSPRGMRMAFMALLFLMGIFEVYQAWIS